MPTTFKNYEATGSFNAPLAIVDTPPAASETIAPVIGLARPFVETALEVAEAVAPPADCCAIDQRHHGFEHFAQADLDTIAVACRLLAAAVAGDAGQPELGARQAEFYRKGSQRYIDGRRVGGKAANQAVAVEIGQRIYLA